MATELHDCPRWSDDASERLTKSFLRSAKTVFQRACAPGRPTPTKDCVAGWHKEIFAHVVPLAYYAGNYRCVDSSQPCLEMTPGVANRPGAPPARVHALVYELFDELKRATAQLEVRWDDLSDEMRIKRLATIVGMAVGRFVHIHPFVNGNGRTSRVLWASLLARHRVPPEASVVRRPCPPYGFNMGEAMAGDYSGVVAMVYYSLMRHAGVRSMAKKIEQ